MRRDPGDVEQSGPVLRAVYETITPADLAVMVPPTLLLTMAGLALVGAIVGALKEITHGPLVLGPMFAFAIALSDMTLFGLGRFFWSLVIGTIITLLLERDGWKRLRAEVAEAHGAVERPW